MNFIGSQIDAIFMWYLHIVTFSSLVKVCLFILTCGIQEVQYLCSG